MESCVVIEHAMNILAVDAKHLAARRQNRRIWTGSTSVSANLAAPSIRCSQLSSTSRSFLAPISRAMDSKDRAIRAVQVSWPSAAAPANNRGKAFPSRQFFRRD